MSKNGQDLTVTRPQFQEFSNQHVETARGHEDSLIRDSSVVETHFAQLEDGSLIEMIEDPDNPLRTLLAICKTGQVRLADRLRCGEQTLVPIPRDRHIIKHIRLPKGAKEFGSVGNILRQIYSIISQCLDLDDQDRTLLAYFVLSTWFIDQLAVAPYLAFVGLPLSGKTTALWILSLLCRRALLTADITAAAFYRACDQLTPTLLIDETGTAGDRRTLFHLLKTGTMRELTAFRKDESFKTFGAKVVSWTELPDDPALNSRCIIIPFKESHRTDLKKPADPEIKEAANELQKQLLQFRFDRYNKLSLPRVQDDEKLHSRTRDLYEALAHPSGEDISSCKWLVNYFAMQQASNREPLLPTQSAVLQFLFYAIHDRPEKPTYILQDIAYGVNSLLLIAGEGFRMNPRKVGAALSSLGFTARKRTNQGFEMMILDLKTQSRFTNLLRHMELTATFAIPLVNVENIAIFARNRKVAPRDKESPSHPLQDMKIKTTVGSL